MKFAGQPTEEVRSKGIPVSPGIAIGPIEVRARGIYTPEIYEIPEAAVESEKRRFRRALDITKKQVAEVRERISHISGESEGKIFDAHLMFLEDRTLLERVLQLIEERRQNAESVFYAVIQNYLEAMRRIPDSYLRERTADIEDICLRVIGALERRDPARDYGPAEGHVLIAYDLSPSDTAMMDPNRILGFATEIGSTNSHTAILARSLGIPAVVGLDRAVLQATMSQTCILDGYKGVLVLNPTPKTLSKYRRLKKQKTKAYQALETIRELPTATIDDHEVVLSANIEFSHELEGLRMSGADGIGLYRTEFFLLENDEMPDEKHQAEVYRGFVESGHGGQTIIRTLDAGGDKISAEPFSDPEPNPFLGWRGIRVSLSRPDIFKVQLRAILRTSAYGRTGVMFPMISGLSELRAAKAVLEECKLELDREGVAFDPDLEVGIMVEVPSAAILADVLAPEVDFFSIGTNDLIQYTVAVDRVNHRVAKLFRTTNPAVVRLLHRTIEAGRDAGIWTGICGEIAGDIRLTPLLVGLGTSELSVGVHQVPIVKKAILSLEYKRCQDLAERVLSLSSSAEVMEATSDMAHQVYPDLFFEA